MKIVSASIQWLRPSEGGRKAPPDGPRYSTVIRFDQQRETWRNEAWSLVADLLGTPDAQFIQQAKVQFFAEGSPEHLLVPGSHFDLMEGDRIVGRGEIL